MATTPATQAGPRAARTLDRRRWTALALLATAQLMLVLDVTVVNVALPDIGTSLRLTRAELPWVMTAYTVVFGGFMLLGGRIADRYGPRRRVGVSFIPVAVAIVAGAHTAARVLARVPARAVALAGLALAGAGFGAAALWPGPAQTVIGMSVAALGIGCCLVTAFTASLADAPAAEGGLRGALVNTFHELGGAAGVALLSTIAGAALVAAHPAAGAFRAAFTAAAACALAAAVIAAFLVPSVPRGDGDGHPAH